VFNNKKKLIMKIKFESIENVFSLIHFSLLQI